jgi:hypothetical protein
VARSLSLDSSLDSKHLQASLRISQNRMSEACDVLEEIYRGIKQNREMLARRTVIEELSAPVNPNPEDDGQEAFLLSLPSHLICQSEIYSEELCITTAKMLIECSTLRPTLARVSQATSPPLIVR